MIKKNIIVLITGQLRFFSKKNYENIIKSFEGHNLDFFITSWEDQAEELFNIFSTNYKPIKIKKIKNKDFSFLAKNVKIPDKAVKTENTFKQWHSFSEGCKEIKNFNFKKKPDFILRYRSDILPKYNQSFVNFELKRKQVLIPDRYHWNGINDQLFLFSFLDLDDFASINNYIINYQKKNLFFSPELIFQRFLKEKKIKIKFNKYNYNIMRKENKGNNSLKDKINVRLGLYDRVTIKLNKFMFRLRNFNDFYLKKNMRNNQQDIII